MAAGKPEGKRPRRTWTPAIAHGLCAGMGALAGGAARRNRPAGVEQPRRAGKGGRPSVRTITKLTLQDGGAARPGVVAGFVQQAGGAFVFPGAEAALAVAGSLLEEGAAANIEPDEGGGVVRRRQEHRLSRGRDGGRSRCPCRCGGG